MTMTAASPDHEVVVVGAGFCGIGSGIRLKESGIHDFVILEQADDIGGTWRDNTYPGVAVDIASSVYSFSFEMNPNWSRTYAPGRELKQYADHCMTKYGLRQHLRLRTRVHEARFDADVHLWRAQIEDLDTGERRELTARFVIGATGGLTQPKAPDIPGLENFGGVTMHTARWDHSIQLEGKRVAVIGTGATAVQVVPSIAPEVKQLSVFQRTPIWCVPKPDRTISSFEQTVYRRVPVTQTAMRYLQTSITETVMVGIRLYYKRFPWANHAVERICLEHLKRQVPDADIRAKLTPDYGFWCKRPTYSNDYWRTFMRDNVDLVTDKIERVTKTGIRTADGRLHKVDVLVLATGFKVFEIGNTPPFPLYGRDGTDLGHYWDAERYQAYLGASVPRFPNLFLMLGPYALTGGSWFQLVENQSRHAVRAIVEARRRGATLVEVRQEAHDRYFAQVQHRQQGTVFFNHNCGGANSYFFDRHGDAPFLRPGLAVEAWWNARTFDLDDYRYEKTSQRALQPVR
ncbi:NAD(P)/FAD-dependent oxidoreductase [Nocardia sp. NPDC051030]|uniref:flavin-containing monooxygenase n=1 Tax=Nocardia sp. NPDC051030 TaxID=3155162 RepID=UPI003421EB87